VPATQGRPTEDRRTLTPASVWNKIGSFWAFYLIIQHIFEKGMYEACAANRLQETYEDVSSYSKSNIPIINRGFSDPLSLSVLRTTFSPDAAGETSPGMTSAFENKIRIRIRIKLFVS
jgi:hypothetical protein